jgi:hypothetical protein
VLKIEDENFKDGQRVQLQVFMVRIPLTLDTDSAHKPITCSG